MSVPWRIYEFAARSVLADIGRALGVESVEGKQLMPGASGTVWELDAKAWREGAESFLVVEVRRYVTSSLKQEDIAALAYRIGDVGALGGIVVSPLPLQQGAEIVARSAGIAHIRLSPNSTSSDYLAEFMGQRFLGASVTESVTVSDWCNAEVIRKGAKGA